MRHCVLLALLYAATGTVASGQEPLRPYANCGRRYSRLADRTRAVIRSAAVQSSSRARTLACFAIPARSPRSGSRVIFRPA